MPIKINTFFMKNSSMLFMVALSFSIPACSDADEELHKVRIRLTNTSEFDYKEVHVNTGGGEFTYGNIDSNESSGYQEFEWAYSYAYIQLKINDEMYVIQPIDYVGEEKLKNGNYTYEIHANLNGGQYNRLTLKLVVN
jgi:hypothetical protein